MNGYVIMEAEHTTSPLGNWKINRELEGYTGTGYLTFTGNRPQGGKPDSPISYDFKINKSGIYQLIIKARKQISEASKFDGDDGYVRMEGNFGPGPNVGDSLYDDANMELLKTDTKFIGGKENSWGWADRLGFGKTEKRRAKYMFRGGETYRLIVSGRSRGWDIDKIILFHSDIGISEARKTTMMMDEMKCVEEKPAPLPPVKPTEKDKVSLQLKESYNCSTNTYCVSLQIKAQSDTFQIGTSSIFLSYDKEVIAFKDYASTSFNGNDQCVEGMVSAWDEHAVDGISVPGKLNLTLSLSSETYSCPVIADEWIEIGKLCFEVKNEKGNPRMFFDKVNTNFNRNMPNDGTSSIPLHKLAGIDKIIDCNMMPAPKPDPMPTPAPDPKPDPMPTPAPDPKPDPMPTPTPDPKPDPMPTPSPGS